MSREAGIERAEAWCYDCAFRQGAANAAGLAAQHAQKTGHHVSASELRWVTYNAPQAELVYEKEGQEVRLKQVELGLTE